MLATACCSKGSAFVRAIRICDKCCKTATIVCDAARPRQGANNNDSVGISPRTITAELGNRRCTGSPALATLGVYWLGPRSGGSLFVWQKYVSSAAVDRNLEIVSV